MADAKTTNSGERLVDQAQLERAVVETEDKRKYLVDAINVRIDAIDRAAGLLHDDLVRVPTLLDRAVVDMKALFGSWLAERDARFERVDTLFSELDKRTTQVSIANANALAAALQAQKELSDKLETTMMRQISNSNDKIDALTTRMDRGEGKVSVSDPAVGAALQAMSAQISQMQQKPVTSVNAIVAWIVGGGLGALIILVASIITWHVVKQ